MGEDGEQDAVHAGPVLEDAHGSGLAAYSARDARYLPRHTGTPVARPGPSEGRVRAET